MIASPLVGLITFAIGAIFGAGVVVARVRATEKGLAALDKKTNKSLIAQICNAESKDERWELAHFFHDL